MELEILTHSGKHLIVSVSSYDAKEVNEKLNNLEINSIELGGVNFSRIDIKLIIPHESNIKIVE